MLSEIIKKRIEEKSGLRIRSSRDCELLANKIISESNCRLSTSTLRRLFGFVKGVKEPHLHTLDVLSIYLGYNTWDELIETLNKKGNVVTEIITEIISSKLKTGSKFKYMSKPDTEVTVKYLGKSRFKVLSASNSQLQANDIITMDGFSLHHPVFILEIERNGKEIGKKIDAKVSGVLTIKKI